MNPIEVTLEGCVDKMLEGVTHKVREILSKNEALSYKIGELIQFRGCLQMFSPNSEKCQKIIVDAITLLTSEWVESKEYKEFIDRKERGDLYESKNI